MTFRLLSRLILVVVLAALAASAGAQSRTRGVTIDEERIALVIGNAQYKPFNPLDNPVNDARVMADVLAKAGFKVTKHENLDRLGLVNAFRQFGDKLTERTVAVVYYAGHALQLRDTNYLIPIDAEIHHEDEIPIAGLSVGFILNRMSQAKSRVNIVILDACRNNPFAEKTRAAKGLAQMDAPPGTLLAFATAPGKLAEDGTGERNSLYTLHLARHLLTAGLPIETVFKRVREAVIRATGQQQVPWESSSLLGEFAFVPGVASTATPDANLEAAGELAFWNSIQAANRADEYRAYLRQYPRGRFAELAQARIAAFAKESQAAAPARFDPLAAMIAAKGGRPELLPRAGDTWRYRVSDQFRIGDLFLTATVAEVTAEGVVETWTTTSDSLVRSTVVPLDAGFHSLPDWSLTPPEFAPYLLAAGLARNLGDARRSVERAVVPLKARVEGEEEVAVAAGRFRATKIVLRGQAQSRTAQRSGPIVAEHVVWYAPAVKRFVKYAVSTRVGGSLQEETVFELTDYKLN